MQCLKANNQLQIYNLQCRYWYAFREGKKKRQRMQWVLGNYIARPGEIRELVCVYILIWQSVSWLHLVSFFLPTQTSGNCFQSPVAKSLPPVHSKQVIKMHAYVFFRIHRDCLEHFYCSLIKKERKKRGQFLLEHKAGTPNAIQAFIITKALCSLRNGLRQTLVLLYVYAFKYFPDNGLLIIR